MKILKRSQRRAPRVSFVLLDWSVRESFHFLHYLGAQNVPRDQFEVLVLEFYSRESDALRPYLSQVDTWAVLEMPTDIYYHKHLMYNTGIALAKGEILVFCDSDAMVREGFVASILAAFDDDPQIVLHLDQFRNSRRDFYPFNFPSFADVLGRGCINNVGGRTKGVARPTDPLRERNYGACMCARRDAVIAVGGADEHLDYLGHICGPYEMTFRLVNSGRRELWHPNEFLFHTWHPGQAGDNNYLGPHDGRHMSTTALESLPQRRLRPFVENQAIRQLREGKSVSDADVSEALMGPDGRAYWRIGGVSHAEIARRAAETRGIFDYRGFRVEQDGTRYRAHLVIEDTIAPDGRSFRLEAADIAGIRAEVDRAIFGLPRLASAVGSAYVLGIRSVVSSRIMFGRLLRKLAPIPGAIVRGLRRAIRRTFDRIQRFFLERSQLSGSLSSVIVNLYFLRRRADLMSAERRPVLLTDSRSVAYYVRALVRMGVLPRLDAVWVRPHEVERWIAEFGRRGATIQPIVNRGLYVKYYSAFSRLGLAQRIIVL